MPSWNLFLTRLTIAVSISPSSSRDTIFNRLALFIFLERSSLALIPGIIAWLCCEPSPSFKLSISQEERRGED